MQRCELALKDVMLSDGRRVDIGFFDGKIVHTGVIDRADEVIRAHGKLLLPAATDIHVHLRDWEQSGKENFRTGTRGAVAGGVTIVVDQPNTVPPLTDPGIFEKRVKDAAASAVCGFAVNAGVVPGTDFAGLWRAGATAFGEIFAGSSSYGDALATEDLENALHGIGNLGGVATVHAEEVGTGTPGDLDGHDMNRSAAGEAVMVTRVCRLCPRTVRLHFCHLSTVHAIEALAQPRHRNLSPGVWDAGGEGTMQISCEVTPHHLLLSREDFPGDDTHGKVNPPLRDRKEQKALWGAWDRIDVIASDHAPHTVTEKAVPFELAPSGIPGVETMIPLLLAETRKRKIPVTSLVEKTAVNPCRVLGLPGAGFHGSDRADFALYPDIATPVDPDVLQSRAGWSPYEGMDAVFPEVVIIGGNIIYRDGDFSGPAPCWYPGTGYSPCH